MLLRSSSTPVLNSWIPNSTGSSSPECDSLPQLTRARSVCLSTSFEESSGRSTPSRFSIDSDSSRDVLKPKKSLRPPAPPKPSKLGGGHEVSFFLSSSGLCAPVEEESYLSETKAERNQHTAVVGGGGGGGGYSVGGGGRGSGDGSGSGSQDPRSAESYYERMIAANPGNPLLLANYAQFLKEIKGDCAKAEEYYGRAILANPGDGSVLSNYADLIWQTHKDSERAETYFDQAVKSDPDDCYVLASYARFLWDVEDDEEESEEALEKEFAHTPSPNMFHEVSHWSPLAAAS